MAFVENAPVRTNDFLNRLEVDGEEGSEFIDHWETNELLLLASSVVRSDRNWVSVTRTIKPFAEHSRPADWYTPKNCALQYTKLLSEIDDDSKKKTLPRTERETSEVMLVKSLTDKRLTELAWLNQQTKATANVLKTYIDMVEGGDFDDQLDDLLKQIEEREKSEEEKYHEYLIKRETLNATKRLNKSRITKGKAASRAIDSKKKLSFSEMSEESPAQTVEEVIKNIKKEIDADEESGNAAKSVRVKLEPGSPSKYHDHDPKATLPSSITPTSPLLTSLLRNVASSSTGSHTFSTVISPLKESEMVEIGDHSKSDMESAAKSREASPRSSVPQSPRPTPASSPLLNSLLKSTPSSTTSIQISPVKEKVSPKAVSSPQPFFNPTSVLATAAAQQLAVATSTLPQFFQQHDASDSRKVILQSSPITSACLSAPTLSKLLEMPPSTPGRLPPLPVLDPPVASTPIIISSLKPEATQSTPKAISTQQLLEEKKASIPDSPSKLPAQKATDHSFLPETLVLQKSSASYSQADKKLAMGAAEDGGNKAPSKYKADMDDTSQENIDILEDVCKNFDQAFEEQTISKGGITEEEVQSNLKVSDILEDPKESGVAHLPIVTVKIEKTSPEMKGNEQTFSFSGSLKQQQSVVPSSAPTTQESPDTLEEDKATGSRRFYKSRVASKKEDTVEKVPESVPSFQSPLKTIQIKREPESPTPSDFASDSFGGLCSRDETELVEKQQDAKIPKVTDSRPPAAKKPRLFERSSTEKTELSEDEAPTTVRRSGRRGKKGRGRVAKGSSAAKQVEPKDQYEFTESTEENSVGYQATNTLCYMPRVKDEDSKSKTGQDPEDAMLTSPITEKKLSTPLRNKPARTSVQQTNVRKALFMSDEERMSDSLTSDEASNHNLSEDKLKKWEETCDKKNDTPKGLAESVKRNSKAMDSSKKKSQPAKRNSVGKSMPTRRERKVSSIDMEELSTGSKDSEEVASKDKDILEEKDSVPLPSVDMEVETNDSHPSSSAAAESDKQLDEMEGCESLQGSITTDFSPPPTLESKDEKDTSQFGKQDWFQGVSPKSSEAVSQSSEESEEYESDNWDTHSASTNKSASHSAGMQPGLRREERESAEYKAWKKSVSIIFREASCHKNANVFLQKVTNDVAPGYLSIVHRPMDLSLIKKNIDNGIVKTTHEFHRDMLLMFQNAIMYNSSDHDVHQMAVEMQKDVTDLILTYVATESNAKDESSEPVSSLRGARKPQKSLGGKQGTNASSTKGKDDADRE